MFAKKKRIQIVFQIINKRELESATNSVFEEKISKKIFIEEIGLPLESNADVRCIFFLNL